MRPNCAKVAKKRQQVATTIDDRSFIGQQLPTFPHIFYPEPIPLLVTRPSATIFIDGGAFDGEILALVLLVPVVVGVLSGGVLPRKHDVLLGEDVAFPGVLGQEVRIIQVAPVLLASAIEGPECDGGEEADVEDGHEDEHGSEE